MRIGILGIGGIGGFVGAPLAKHYYPENENDIEIIFICRGDTKEEIVKNGLTIKSRDKIENVRPHLVSDNPIEIGILDVLLVTTKSFSLIDAINSYRSCLDTHSTIITLQNMVNAKEVIIENFGNNEFNILDGCIYVASNIKKPGYVEHLGGPGKIFIGGNLLKTHEVLIKVFKDAEIDISFVKDMETVLWKKYLFVAPVAAITTAYNVTFGELLIDVELMLSLENMMYELRKLASIKGIDLSEMDIQTSIGLLSKFPYEAKSSLQLDYEKDNLNEKYYLVDYIIEECVKENVDYPFYKLTNIKINQ
ncbi:2-dehydropantoate 2-reductase [Flavobacteriaceae bacterium 3-367]|uniref:ketopantoate reductase family protein n=1 Tax=Eudoraea algarum TaxID=3417568 RepID=UPI00327129A9